MEGKGVAVIEEQQKTSDDPRKKIVRKSNRQNPA